MQNRLGQKEVTPVLYGGGAVKILSPVFMRGGSVCFSAHWHERMELLYVISGTLSVEIDDARCTVPTGGVAIIPPETTHSGYALKNETAYYTVMFDLDALSNSTPAAASIFGGIKNHRVKLAPFVESEATAQLLQRLCSAENADISDTLFSEGLLYCIVAELYRTAAERQPAAVADSFAAITEYIDSHFAEPLTASEISHRFGYTEAYFCRKFKKLTGLTVSEYVNALRLDRAKAALKRTDSTAAAIAAECGFCGYSYFCRLFKKRFGCTPSEYKRKAL